MDAWRIHDRAQLADDLGGWDALAVSNLLATLGNRSLEASPIFGIELVVVIWLDKLQADFGTFREIDSVLDDDSSALYATIVQPSEVGEGERPGENLRGGAAAFRW